MAAIVIHKWVRTHGIYFIPRFCPQNPAPDAADRPHKARPVRPYTKLATGPSSFVLVGNEESEMSLSHGAINDHSIMLTSYKMMKKRRAAVTVAFINPKTLLFQLIIVSMFSKLHRLKLCIVYFGSDRCSTYR